MVTIYGDQQPEQHTHSELDLHAQLADEGQARQARQARRPWFKKPSIAWILCMKTLSSLSLAIASGPRLEIFTEIVCREYYRDRVAPDATGWCAGDPRVQAEVARVNALFAMINGSLAFLTAGWWGGFMDRYGRTRVMSIAVFAPLFNDTLFLLAFLFPNKIPGGYWILVINPIVEGILGIPSSTAAVETTYMRDVSEPRNLSRNFALLVGIYHTGGTIGPIIGGFLNERAGSVITAFYATTMVHLVYASIAWFALPESASEASMLHARHRFAHALASAADADVGPFRRQLMVLSRAFWDSFPFHVLTPRRLPNSQWKRDWNLTLLAISAGLVNAIMASQGDVLQYTLYTFKWSSLQLGYFISASGFSAAIFLTLILPTIVSVLKTVPAKAHTEDSRKDTAFDLRLLRVSSLIFAAGYASVAFAPTGVIFTLCYMVINFGQGFIPAVQSVATMLYANASGKDDAGRLLSALGVVYGLGGRLVGPLLFGTVFSNTVSFFPTAIFWVAVGCALTVFLLLAFVRLPNAPNVRDAEQNTHLLHEAESELDPLLEHE